MSHDQPHTHKSFLSPRHSLPAPVRLGLALTLLAVALILIPAQIARADGPVVNTTADNESDGCGVGNCTLREAILDPTAHEGITFDVTGVITWTGGMIALDQTIVITGPGSSDLTVWGNSNRFLSLNAGITVTMSGITLQHFYYTNTYSWGGAISVNNARLIIDNCVFRDNQTAGNSPDSGYGGAISARNSSTLIVQNSLFDNNRATDDNGGAIGAHRPGDGDPPTMIISGSTFTRNSASDSGGAISCYNCKLRINNSTIGGSEANANVALGSPTYDQGGGGVWAFINRSDVAITNTTISYNRTHSMGGGLMLMTIPRVNITGSTISHNSATSGGGIESYDSVTIIDHSTISANHADADGGGIRNLAAGTVTITHSTISHNDAITSGGGIYNPSNPVSVTNTIVAANTASSSPNCNGAPTSYGYNLESGTECGFTETGDQQSTDPLLGPLQDNGGPSAGSGQAHTWTRALPSNSPAADAGNCNGATTDQRGKPRPIDLPGFANDPNDSCDIGACEAQLDAAVAPPPNNHTSPPATISITYDEPVSLTTVTSRTFAIHAMQTGLVTAAHGVNGNTIVVTPTHALHAGELVQTTATTATLNVTGTQPLRPTVWQFRAAVQGGSGNFGAHPIRPTFGTSNSYGVALGDLDGDGDLDAVIANYGAQQQVWLNDGNGDFGAAAFDTVGSGDSTRVVLGDLDGDGDLDAIVANYGAAQQVYLNNGSGNFGTTFDTVGSGSSASYGVALGDLDGDGDLDAVVANYGAAQDVHLNDGSGNFTTFDTFGSGNSRSVALGDVDGDDDLDAIVANDGAAQEVYLNNGRGNFAAFDTFGDGDSRCVALGDVDRDGDLDAVVANHNARQQVHLNDGSGNFAATFDTFGVLSGDSTTVALGDVDGDGDVDAIVANTAGQTQETWLNHSDTDLSIAKSVTPSIAAPGGTITYTITFSNSGSEIATGITITDTVPFSVTVSSIVSSGVAIGQLSPGYVWYVPSLVPGQVGVITITGELDNGLSHDDTFTNTAKISGIVAETSLDDNSDDAPITIDDEPPLPPVLDSPLHNFAISDTTPTLGWNPSFDAAGYMLDFDGDITDVQDTTAYTTGVLADGAYTWTVAAYDYLGNTSIYTDVWSFILDSAPPGVPVLSSPEDGDVISDPTPPLSWSTVPGAVGYMLDFNSDIIDVGNTTLSTTGVLTDSVYVWTVASYDNLHNVSNYADAWSFTVDTAPPRVENVTPPGGANNIPRNTPVVVYFDEAMDTGSVSYTITPTITLTPAWDAGNARLTLTHDRFAATTRHTVTVSGGSDPAGNPLSNAPYTRVFTTGIISTPEADLALGKARAGEQDVTAGEPITYTFTITNFGPTAPVTATIVDTFFNDAAALGGVSGKDCVWPSGAQVVTCTVTGISTNTPSVLTLVVTTNNAISSTMMVTNVAIIAPVGDVIDPQPDNNSSGPVTVTVHANQPPEAVAGENRIEHICTVIALDGSDSRDPDGHIPLTYGWTQTGGAPTVLLSNSAISQPTFTTPGTPTVLTLTLVVTDALGAVSEPDTLVVTITEWYIYLPVTIRNSPTSP